MAGLDRFEAMGVFVRVVERRSFTRAAEDLGLPRSTVTTVVQQLEARLGVRLLHRTTRHVSPTLDGEAYHRRALAIMADVEDAEGAFRGASPKGLVRAHLHGTLAHHFLLPKLPEFLLRYPGVRLHLGEGDRLVDLVQEGIDCVLRAGEPRDSNMIGRRVALLPEITCASPAYLERYGTPRTPDELEGHRMIGFFSTARKANFPLEFIRDGEIRELTLPADVSVEGAETNIVLAKLGMGIIQVPRYHVEADLAAGSLLEILQDWRPAPMPVSLLYPESRQLSPRVRVFADWVAATMREATA
jgi:DNA-binding transcriptional LysR family regulator